jgi:transposase
VPDAPDVVAALQEANARLRSENADLRAENAELKRRLARLERLISRNSGNSSMPPSGDDQLGKKPPEQQKRGAGKRKPGKQRGAPGAHLEWNENPDGTVACFPEGTCDCGTDLADARDLGVRYSHQVTDLLAAKAETTQYDRHAVECACGTVHVAGAMGVMPISA